MNPPHLLTEAACGLIVDTIKTNIVAQLALVRTYWADAKVTTEPPPTESYFIYPKARGYRMPAIFVEDDGTEFQQAQAEANYIHAKMSINVSVKVEDKDQYKLMLKSWRYASALHAILEQANLASSDNSVKLVVKVTRIKPTSMYTIANDDADQTAQFFKEYVLFCEVEFWENL